MKWFIIITAALLLLFILSQLYTMNASKDIESYKYTVLKTFDGFEVRHYEAANFSSVTIPNEGYESSSSKGFRSLGGYIFGGNESGEKIAMTSPVTMDMDDSMTMMFMIPSEYDMEDLPAPSDKSVTFKTVPERTMAAIRFGGWANDEKIEQYKAKLAEALKAEGISHTNQFQFFGYNPPYELINQRNEVLVELEGPDSKF